MTSVRTLPLNTNLWKGETIKHKYFYLINSGKAQNDLALLVSIIHPALLLPKWERTSIAGRKKHFPAESFACRRPLLGQWIISSMPRAALTKPSLPTFPGYLLRHFFVPWSNSGGRGDTFAVSGSITVYFLQQWFGNISRCCPAAAAQLDRQTPIVKT